MSIYLCADDFGLTCESDGHITECRVNKISVLGNCCGDFSELAGRISTHINLVEGKSVSDKSEVCLLVDENGYFKHTFFGLLKLSLGKNKKEFKRQIKTEMLAQIKAINAPEMIDSHQHVHMIPLIFTCLCEIIEEEKLPVKYLRVPAEPITPYLSVPALYPDYFSVNLIKQWTLKFFNLFNKKKLKKIGLVQNDFFGIMFSGNMNEKRVKKLLKAFLKHSEKKNRDLEILFHPGYIETAEGTEKINGYKFSRFYLSAGRKREYDAVNTAASIVGI